ncbi:hypothetical protein, partial [Klebsiella pneumoniae]|uniref:hypothetical protein n=1 Tax=Klebsiella pneumoniae TaxID=573 RepID=UPI002732061B
MPENQLLPADLSGSHPFLVTTTNVPSISTTNLSFEDEEGEAFVRKLTKTSQESEEISNSSTLHD